MRVPTPQTPLAPRPNALRAYAALATLALACAASACTPPPASSTHDASGAAESVASEQALIFGADDRLDYTQVQAPMWRDMMRNSVALMVYDYLIWELPLGGGYLQADTQGNGRNLCPDVRFREQAWVGSCSGTLVDDDLIMTARHCMPNMERCDETRWVFGIVEDENGLNTALTRAQIYRCEELIAPAYGEGIDAVFVRLDRPVEGELTPVERWFDAGAVEAGDTMVALGGPSGLPVKYTPGVVVDGYAQDQDVLTFYMDAFGGNSGSGVFTEDGALAGIVTRGFWPDYVPDGDCMRPRVVHAKAQDETPVREISMYAARAREALCASGFASADLCAPGAWPGVCGACEDASDCPSGWSCAEQGEARMCAAPCEGDADCRADHSCQAGLCMPDTHAGCDDSDAAPAMRNACGVVTEVSAACADGERCFAGTCAPTRAALSCAEAHPLEPVDQVLHETIDGAAESALNCARHNASGPEHVYRLDLDEATTLDAQLRSGYGVLHLRRDCEDMSTERFCTDAFGWERFDSDRHGRAHLRQVLEPGAWFLIVDTERRGGTYELTLDFDPACDTCTPGERRCASGYAQHCVASPNADACPIWTHADRCDGSQVCTDGVCMAPARGGSCDDALPIATTNQTLDVRTRQQRDDMTGSCGGNWGVETIYTFTVDAPTHLRALAMATETDPVLYLRNLCDDTNFGASSQEEACSDDIDGLNDRSALLDVELAAGTWFLFADAFKSGGEGYTVELEFTGACQDVCLLGATRCGEGGDAERCALSDEGCLAWTTAEVCGDLTCSDGQCAPPACQDTCPEPGALRCNPDNDAVERCVASDQGCLTWTVQEACASSCADAACARADDTPNPPGDRDAQGDPAAPTNPDSGGFTSDGPDAPEGGCAITAPHPAPAPSPWLIVLAATLLSARLRRTRHAR